jgi:hypothetical protein
MPVHTVTSTAAGASLPQAHQAERGVRQRIRAHASLQCCAILGLAQSVNRDGRIELTSVLQRVRCRVLNSPPLPQSPPQPPGRRASLLAAAVPLPLRRGVAAPHRQRGEGVRGVLRRGRETGSGGAAAAAVCEQSGGARAGSGGAHTRNHLAAGWPASQLLAAVRDQQHAAWGRPCRLPCGAVATSLTAAS